MEIKHANEDNFDSLTNKGLVLVDFFANWCGPCRMLGSQLEELASDRSEVEIIKVNVDENPGLAKKFGIMSIPVIMLYKDGQQIDKKIGFMPKELIENWINENK